MESAALAGALWLGILTAVSPCPLATNMAALSFVARQAASPRRVLQSGAAYTLVRILSYTILAALLVSGLLTAPGVSFFLQKHLNQLMGPLMVLTGAALLDWLPLPSFGVGGSDRIRKWGEGGTWGAFALGMLFALAFCPVSAALFFMGLVPLALKADSRILLPSLYGLGTALPVAVLAAAVSAGVKKAAGVFNRMTAFEKWMRLATGWLFLILGVYWTFTRIFLAK
jgi:cytochrome c-type biogenesis protein